MRLLRLEKFSNHSFAKIIRNYIIIGVTSFNLGCNSIQTEDGESVFINGYYLCLKLLNPGKKLPSVYADIRGESVKDWIDEQTAGAFFCRKSGQVKEVKEGESNLINFKIELD